MNVDRLIDATSRITGIERAEILNHTANGGNWRRRMARGIIAKILRDTKDKDYSLANVGKILGGYNHSSVLYMVKTIEKDIAELNSTRLIYEAVCDTIGTKKQIEYQSGNIVDLLEGLIDRYDNGVINERRTGLNLIRKLKSLKDERANRLSS